MVIFKTKLEFLKIILLLYLECFGRRGKFFCLHLATTFPK
jgi:hypothetical protein